MAPQSSGRRWRAVGVGVAFVVSGIVLAVPSAQTTPAFLGSGQAREGARLVLQQYSPLFGGREYHVSGDGVVHVVEIRRGDDGALSERRFRIAGARARVDEVFTAVAEADLLRMPLEREGLPGPTCSEPARLLLRNASGEVRVMPRLRWAPSAQYERLLALVARLGDLVAGAAPEHEGALQPDDVPPASGWARELVLAGRRIAWAPHATAEDRARAEAEYSRKVAAQLEAIRRVREEEAASRR